MSGRMLNFTISHIQTFSHKHIIFNSPLRGSGIKHSEGDKPLKKDEIFDLRNFCDILEQGLKIEKQFEKL